MGKVTVDATVRVRFEHIDRDTQTPENLRQVVQRKVEEALESSGATEVAVTSEARDG